MSKNALELERKKESNGIYLFNFIVGKAINFNSFILFFFSREKNEKLSSSIVVVVVELFVLQFESF